MSSWLCGIFCYLFYDAVPILGSEARSSVFGWGTMLQAGMSRVRFVVRSFDFSIGLILLGTLWPVVDSASNRNEYQESSWRRPARKADNHTAIRESIA
jgi:hypothetical protein